MYPTDVRAIIMQALARPLTWVLAFTLLLMVIGAAVVRSKSIQVNDRYTDHTVACADTGAAKSPTNLVAVRQTLGCYENTTDSTLKAYLASPLGGACQALAATDTGLRADLGDGTGFHPLTVPEVDQARGLAREIKDAGVKCPAIPRDPDDYSVAIKAGTGLVVLGTVALFVLPRRRRLTTAVTDLYANAASRLSAQ